MTIITDERCTLYESLGHPERPFRVAGSVKKIKLSQLEIQWIKPNLAPIEKVLRAHSKNHFQRLSEPYDFEWWLTSINNVVKAIAHVHCDLLFCLVSFIVTCMYFSFA